MSDILGPEEARRLLRVEGWARPITDEDAQAVLALIDALAEALRAEHIFRMAVVNDAADMDELLSAQRAANATLSRVAAWLEESNG